MLQIFLCDICDWKTTWRSQFTEHRRLKHNIIKKKTIHKKSKKSKESNEGTQCSQCGKCFLNNSKLAVHVAGSHEKKNKGKYKFNPRICKKCGFKAESLYLWQCHKYATHEKGQTTCTLCGSTFKIMNHYRRHMRSSHTKLYVNVPQNELCFQQKLKSAHFTGTL